MSFKLTGTIKVLKPTVQVSEKFSKRVFVLTDSSSMYPQYIEFQATQDKCAMLDSFSVGQEVEVSFNLKGREWIDPQGEAKYFNSLEAWKIEPMGVVDPQGQPSMPPIGSVQEREDDLPF